MLKLFVRFEDGRVAESIVATGDPSEVWGIWEDTKDPLYETVHGEVIDAWCRPLSGSERIEIVRDLNGRLGR